MKMKGMAIALAAGLSLMMTGCAGFFVPVVINPTTPGTGTGDYVYVANGTTSTLAGYSITAATGALTAVTNSPYTLSFVPTSLAITPNNQFLYVGGVGVLFVYAINADGSLTIANSGSAVGTFFTTAQAMDVSPDGQWLFVLNGDAATLSQFQINATNGVLTQETGAVFSVGGSSQSVRIAPNGAYVFVALGTGGDLVYTFNTSTGALGASPQQLTPPVQTSDNALAVDANSAFLYIARSGGVGSGLAAYSILNGGGLKSVTGSPTATGAGPYSVALDATGTFAYVGNRTDGTISGYSVATGGVLTKLASSPYATGTLPIAIKEDNTKKYMVVAANGGTPDLSIYAFDAATPGKLDLAASTATGTDPTNPVALAVTH